MLGIAVDDSYAYLCELHGSFYRVGKATGENEIQLSIDGCAECVIHDGLVFATHFLQKRLRRSLPDGGSPLVLHSDEGNFEGLAVDDTHVFYTSSRDGQLFRVGRDGTGLRLLDKRVGSRRVTLDETHVYWLAYDSSDVYRTRKDGAEISVVATGPNFTKEGGIAVDDAWVYWIVSHPQEGALLRAPKAATKADAEVLVGGLDRPIDVKVDGDALYFTVAGNEPGRGRLMRLAKP